MSDQAVMRIAADFASIPFPDHEAKTLAVAYLYLVSENQRLRLALNPVEPDQPRHDIDRWWCPRCGERGSFSQECACTRAANSQSRPDTS